MRRPLAALAAAVAVVQLWLAHRYFGFLTGDEVEVLGEAFRRAHGFAYGPWPIRNLFVPDVVVGPFVWIAAHVGVHDPGALILAAALPFIALTAATLVVVDR